jgi:putative glutamine amidotransferase
MSQKKNYKVYVIGSSKGYGRWIEGYLIDNMEDADVVVLTGGEDISPSIYGEPNASPSHVYNRGNETISTRDAYEIEEYKKALELGKPIWGTCRGAQLLCALAGGKLVQDMNHWGSHDLVFYDEEYTMKSNSLHHQLQYPYPIDKREYTILAYSLGLSRNYSGTGNKEMKMPERTSEGVIKEPEFVYYSKTKGLGIQGHPEMMERDSKMVKTCQAFLNLLVDKQLDNVIKLNLPVSEIIERAWSFKLTSDEKQLLKQLEELQEIAESV